MAYPYIADLAGPNPKKAEELARTFFEVWLKKNDPNSSRNRASIYNFSYGFNQRASGIPLTRSRQDRNLKDLTRWVGKLREIEGLELDSDLLMRCFTQCHSEAEVYRVEILEEVFGDLESLEPATLASMAQRMRGNLATIWRTPAAQKAAKTNRKKKDIEAEVQRGYEIAQALLGRAIVAHPDAWQLQVARGAMLHDLNNYSNDLQKGSDYSGNRKAALGVLENAAKTYCAGIEGLRTDEYTTDPLITWFNASLGASDIQAVTEKTLVARSEIAKIQALLESLPGEAGEMHRSMFANTLFTRLSAVNPACKNRYLDAGFEIVGDHPQAEAARRVYDYYADLVTEIELLAELDGSSNVGTEPFGLRVDLRYTKEIGREAGGFARYLQNQGNAVNYYYNYGRPQENYRDKFEEAVRAVLSEQFEVMSVTFNREDAAAKADDEFGWRRMSYCYLLLKARQPDVDRIPPLKIDLDFNDVTGYVVLPISSPVLPIDAGGEADARPFEDLQLTQILDVHAARRRGSSRWRSRPRARARARPRRDHRARPARLRGLQDGGPGVSVARFADDEEGVVSERIWMVEFAPRKGVENPETFAFAAPRDEGAQAVYQRYDDADLMAAEAVVNLEQSYSNPEGFQWSWLLLVPVLAAIAWFVGLALRTDDEGEALAGPELPENLTPVNVLGLLAELRAGTGSTARARERLDAAVLEIEQHYFGESSERFPDLAAIAREGWAGARNRADGGFGWRGSASGPPPLPLVRLGPLVFCRHAAPRPARRPRAARLVPGVRPGAPRAAARVPRRVGRDRRQHRLAVAARPRSGRPARRGGGDPRPARGARPERGRAPGATALRRALPERNRAVVGLSPGREGLPPEPLYDPLAFWIDEAHARGLQLHAWFNPYRAAHPSRPGPPSEGSVLVTRPEMCVTLGDGGYRWLDPARADVQRHSLAVILDVVRRYDVDGVHFDDYFYPYPSYADGAGFPDEETWRAYRQAGGRLGRADWRRRAVDRFVQDVAREVHRVDPHVLFSVSPFGIWRPGEPEGIAGFDAHEELYADARKWLREGWVDALAPQLYWPIGRVAQSFPCAARMVERQNPLGRHLWAGTSIARMEGEEGATELVNQVMVTRGMTPELLGPACSARAGSSARRIGSARR